MRFDKKVFRKWCRLIHRDLSFFFAGILLIYAISGILMNHRDTINPNYSLTRYTYTLEEAIPSQAEIDKAYVLELLSKHDEQDNYTKHYFPAPNQLKVFLKGGSNFLLDMEQGEVLYESVKRRPILGPMVQLHYNPGKWWTVFADLFALGLIVITLTGLVLVRGRKGLLGRGGIELILGLVFPLIFLIFF